MTLTLKISADQRYEFWVDGERTGRGPERGDLYNWFYESYELSLEPGEHIFLAKVWSLDLEQFIAPAAQITLRHGFILSSAPESGSLSTGVAAWEARLLPGYSFQPPPMGEAEFLAGGAVTIDGTSRAWEAEAGGGDGWHEPVLLFRGREFLDTDCFGVLETHRLRPALLPPMLEEKKFLGRVRFVEDLPPMTAPGRLVAEANQPQQHPAWQSLLDGTGQVTVPPRCTMRVVVDLENYYCAYPELTACKGRGAKVRMHWAEALSKGNEKGNRDEILGKEFVGKGNLFLLDGGMDRLYSSLWWRCGRYVELLITTAEEELVLKGLAFRETRYPLALQSQIEEWGDPQFLNIVPILWRTMQVGAHETFTDSPYYEQLMYAGDCRLESLVTYVTTTDHRLPRKAIELFDFSRMAGGLTQARYSCNLPQIIPQFSLIWIGMVHDYAMWHGEKPFVRERMAGVRSVLEHFISCLNGEHLLVTPEGWDWVDWVPGWHRGNPPSDIHGTSSINCLQLAWAMRQAVELERWMGEDLLAQRLENIRRLLILGIRSAYWNEARKLFSDTREQTSFSEHAQAYALLAGVAMETEEQHLVEALHNMQCDAKATIYFTHYVLEALTSHGQINGMEGRLKLWLDLPAAGFRTLPEQPEPSRSDCHAWGAHPLFHAFASVAGIRPAEFGFSTVCIRPQMGSLSSIRVEMAHPKGPIELFCKRTGEAIQAQIVLPPGMTGSLITSGGEQPLSEGRTETFWKVSPS